MPVRRRLMERILVVEDSSEVAQLMVLALQIEGYTVIQAKTGDEAIRLACDEEPALILMDVMMPGITGFEVARRLKADPRAQDIPIIFVTARHDIDDRVHGLEFAVDYISKPFAVPELVARVRAALRMQKLQADLKTTNEQLSRLATTDPLTGLLNRRGFGDQIEDELHRARRFGQPLGLVTFDLDHFKAVNDTYGHGQGDVVLQRFAQVLMHLSRRVDKVARFGGEEFAVLLPNTDRAGVHTFCEKVRARVEEQSVDVTLDGGPQALRVTVSGGAAVLVPSPSEGADGHDEGQHTARLIAGLFELADRYLYEAKQTGRNRIVTRAVSEQDALGAAPLSVAQSADAVS